MKKGYWLRLVVLLLIAIAPLVVMITYPIFNATSIIFLIYGVLSLVGIANLASYLTNCYTKKVELGRIWIRVASINDCYQNT